MHLLSLVSVRWALIVVRRASFVVRRASFVVCRASYVMCCASSIVRCLISVKSFSNFFKSFSILPSYSRYFSSIRNIRNAVAFLAYDSLFFKPNYTKLIWIQLQPNKLFYIRYSFCLTFARNQKGFSKMMWREREGGCTYQKPFSYSLQLCLRKRISNNCFCFPIVIQI